MDCPHCGKDTKKKYIDTETLARETKREQSTVRRFASTVPGSILDNYGKWFFPPESIQWVIENKKSGRRKNEG